MKQIIFVVGLFLLSSGLSHAQKGPPGWGKDKAPKVGDKAPDFTAKKVGKKELLNLSKHVKKTKKPVVLIFGSYT